MGKRNRSEAPIATDSSALTHNPFAALGERIEAKSAPPHEPATTPHPPVSGNSTPELQFPNKVVLRRETKGRAGKTVTRLSGIPSHLLAEVASRLRKALGCGAVVEAEDVVLLGAMEERAWSWLLANGAKRLAKGSQPGPRRNETSGSASEVSSDGLREDGTMRAHVRRGGRVAVVLKEHQASGELTEGVVRDVLTNSARHPRGIKVRLESGLVGRVRRIL